MRMCMCMCSSLYGSLRNGSSFLFRVRSICKPANGALVLLLADNPDDVVGTVSANMRRLGCDPYPGDRPEKPMAFRRDGLPEGPAPLNLQKDLAVRAAYIQINGAPPCAPRQFPRTPHPAFSPPYLPLSKIVLNALKNGPKFFVAPRRF